MKILYFSQFYTPESMAASFRATENAKIWSQLGHNVTVFTGYPNYPMGRIFEGYNVVLLSEENIDDVRVLRSKLMAVPNTSTFKRLQNSLSFFTYGIYNVIFNSKKIGKNYDVVLGTSGVIFTAFLAWIYAWLNDNPFIFEIRDITYKQMQATGRNKGSLSVRIMKFLELFLCKKAEKVVVVTNGFKKTLVEEGIPHNKIEVITNGVDVNESIHITSNVPFVLSYFGTLGISQSIKNTFKYAEVISEYCDNFKYLIIGEGADKKNLESEARKRDYSFVKMIPGMPMDELEQYYEQTQWSIITLTKSEDFKDTIPSKLFQIMGRGIAVLFIGPDGETAEIIRELKSGIALTGTLDEDIAVLREFFKDECWMDRLLEMGQRGRAAVLENYSRKNLSIKYLKLFEEVRN